MNISKWTYCPHCGSKKVYTEKNHFLCNTCKRVIYQNVATTASIAFYTPEGETVLCERAREPFKGFFDFPGGYVDPKENGQEAITREVREELDFTLDQKEITLLITAHDKYPLQDGDHTHFLDLSFIYPITRAQYANMKALDDVASTTLIAIEKIDEKKLAWEHDLLTIQKLKEHIAYRGLSHFSAM